jgi:hypothetical protein
MTQLHPDLSTVLDSVLIQSPARFAVRGQIHELADPSPEDPSSAAVAAREQILLAALETDLYKYLYIRPPGPWLEHRGDELARRERLTALSSANASRGSWNGGWVVRAIDRDGRLVLFKDDLAIWATPDQVRPQHGKIQVGNPCGVWMGKERRNGIPGFYFAFGETEDEFEGDDSEPLVRYYWHLRSEAAVPFVATATELLGATGAPFFLKVLADPGAFQRADAGLIFVRKQYHPRVVDAIARIHEALASRLRESVPLFTKFVAPGLGAAESPSGRISFGEHRCKLAAKALWRSFLRHERDRAAREATFAAVYTEAGLDPRYPYLAAGSTDDFHLAIAPGVKAPSTSPTDRGFLPAISPREAAIRIGESLCRKAIWDVTGRYCNWIGRVSSRDAHAEGPQPATAAALGPGLNKGSAGIALFLAELHTATGNDEFRRTALAAIARSRLPLVEPCARDPDSARTTLTEARDAAMFLLRTALEDPVLKKHRKAATRAAIAAVLEVVDLYIDLPRFDATVSEGLAGLGDIVLSAGLLLKDRSYQGRARGLAQTLIDRYSEHDDWPTGLPCGGPNPSLLLGTAGIGYWLLRLDDPALMPCWRLADQVEAAVLEAKLSAFSA